MMKLLLFSLCVLFCSVLLRDKNRSFALIISLCGACCVLLFVFTQLSAVSDKLKKLADDTGQGDYISLMIKLLAITLLTQGVSDVCRDNGENALAGVCEFGAKIMVVSLMLPLFETLITVVGGMIK